MCCLRTCQSYSARAAFENVCPMAVCAAYTYLLYISLSCLWTCLQYPTPASPSLDVSVSQQAALPRHVCSAVAVLPLGVPSYSSLSLLWTCLSSSSPCHLLTYLFSSGLCSTAAVGQTSPWKICPGTA
jgi:hypothetical protein